MDGTITWMLVLAGATVALLGAFLVASEKELRKKRREVASLAAKLSRSNTGIVADHYQNNLDKLENANKELQEQLSALSSRLESTEHEFTQLDTEKRQLELSNQKLNEAAAALRLQLNSALQTNEESHSERAAFDEQLASLGSELKSKTAKLEQAKRRIEELENSSALSALANAERSLTQCRGEYENNLQALQRELADCQDKLQAFDALKRQLLDLEEKYDNALIDNRQLQQEITHRQERPTDREVSQPASRIIGHKIDDSALRSEISDGPGQMRVEGVRLLENDFENRHAEQSGIVLRSAAAPALSGIDGLESYGQTTASHTSIKYVEPDRNENEKARVALEPQQSADRRTAQLSHLLAWIRLHGSDTYREQIDSLKDFTDLSERERQVVRDIFLARADEAQKRGRDDEMLRYRSWAKNIVYRTRFADEEIEYLSEIGTTEKKPGHPAGADPTAIATIAGTTDTNARKALSTTVQADGSKSPAGNIALGIGVGLGLILILLVQLFFDTSAEITVASYDASTPAVELRNRQQSMDENRPAIVSDNAPEVDGLRSQERVRAKPEDAKTAVRNPAKETAAKSTQSQSIFGAYTIVKSTPVYSQASEESALITSLDPGTQVNVVAARRGWYEIRSRSGRPPGFIRQEDASRNR
ncbi:MAG TPA: SH3 domain-containing protein [Candidatus Polarisedimenticolaceae bacterium]|nr:SH3 domain-containing protein [Candidatus Polarisedimenticolaceae bacterium]